LSNTRTFVKMVETVLRKCDNFIHSIRKDVIAYVYLGG
jgi:hypothetical protein